MIRWELTQAITSGYDDFGFVGIQPAAFGTKDGADSGMGAYQQIMPHGYFARPLDKTADGNAAWVLAGVEGGKGYVLTLQDPRSAANLPPHSKGSCGLCNDDGTFFLLDHDAQTATLYVKLDGGTKAHAIQVGYDSSSTPKLCLNLIHANGMAILMSDETVVIKNAAGDAYIELNADGIVQNGNTKLVGGLDVGGSGAQPMINLTLFEAWWAGVVAAVTAVPVYGSAVGGAMATMTASLPGTGTTLAKSI
jgi:hypothetical protein